MTKKNPGYENGWHTTGTLEVLPSVDQIAERLRANPAVEMHCLNTGCPDGWWSYDAVWTVDGARVRGRLNIHNQHPNDANDPVKAALDPVDYDSVTDPTDGYFHVYAEADRPWEVSWPSPLDVFLEKKLKPSYVSMRYGQHNSLHPKSTKNLSGLLGTLAEMPWLVAVLTHDEMDPAFHFSTEGRLFDTPLVSRLPSSLYGRVLDVRVIGETARRNVNRITSKYGTQLPEGGVALLLASERRKGVPKSDLSFSLDRPFVKGGDIAPVVASLTKLFTSQVMVNDKEAIDELRENWFLLTDSEEAQQDLDLLRSASMRIEELEQRNEELLTALNSGNELIRKLVEGGKDITSRAAEALERERKATEEMKRHRKHASDLLCMIRDSDLGKARAAQEAAENDAEAAEELLDEQTHELTSLRQENAQLRSELARLGSTFTSAPVEEAVPENWDEFFVRASSLEYVALGDVEAEVDKLRGQAQERTFIRRSWEALLALEEYVRLKKERGNEELPHFHAYLMDPSAEYAIPRTRYSSTESKGVMMNSKFVAARTLPVPRQVDPSGKVVMEAHIRIGSGKPPAPRMHFHDDTNGATGKIHVGHLGPHLPNYQTN